MAKAAWASFEDYVWHEVQVAKKHAVMTVGNKLHDDDL